MEKPVLVIMAAGMGSRYGGLKQMDPMDEYGHLIIDYSIYDAVRAGFSEVYFIIREENEKLFREKISDRLEKYVRVHYVYQKIEDLPYGYEVPKGRVKPWGTGHAILSCVLSLSGKPFAVINADDYYGPEAFRLIYDYLLRHGDDETRYRYAMVAYKVLNTVTENGTVSRGVCDVDAANYLKSITERTKVARRGEHAAYTEDDGASWSDLPDDTVVSMNMWGFTSSILKELLARFPKFLDRELRSDPLKCEFYLPFAVDELLKENKASVKVLTTPDRWYGVTYKEDKPQVCEALRKMREDGTYPEKLWE